MNGLSFSLYDALNKLIIGAIIFLPLMVSGGCCMFNQNTTVTTCLITVLCFLCGLILWLLLGISTKGCTGQLFGSNSDDIIDETFKEIHRAYPRYRPRHKGKRKECYLGAYYRVQQAGLLGNIPVLEAISEFFKNLFVAVVLSAVPLEIFSVPLIRGNGWWYYFGAVIVSMFISYKGRYYAEYKIHYLVWEADYFRK
jgi:hypothetical protein